MDYFWDIVQTIDRTNCDGFSHYDAGHIIWLVFFLCVLTGCTLLYRKVGSDGAKAPDGRRRIRLVFAGILIANELLKYVVVAMNGTPLIAYLPLQLCSISVTLVIIHALVLPAGETVAVGRSTAAGRTAAAGYIGNFLYLVGLPASLAALLFPSWTALPAIANIMSIHSFTAHILVVTYVIMLLVAREIRPEVKTVPVSVCALIAMAAGVYRFDVAFQMNYMYLVRLSPSSPLAPFEALGDYRIGYAVILAALILVLYVIPAIKKALVRKA